MIRITGQNMLRFTIFSILFSIPLTMWSFSVTADNSSQKNGTQKNIETFVKIEASDIGKTGIAIASNLGLRYGNDTAVFDTYFQETLSAKEILQDRNTAEKTFIINNMIATREYLSILKTNFREQLKNAGNKEASINGIINQLDIRLNVGKTAQQNITTQKEVFIKTMKKIDTELEKIKKQINTQFKSGDTVNIQASIKNYLDLKEKYTYLRTHLVFADKFIAYYHKLNKYTEKLVTALKLNRDIIIKGSYLVIPNDGNTVLREYGLLYTEEEIKNILDSQKQEEQLQESKIEE